MFSFTFDDFDHTIDTRTLQGICGVALQHNPDCTIASASTKKNLITFISKLEYKTSGQYPSQEDIKEIREMIEKI
jgi:hypothetical protein